jgi:hypothetical protein
MTRFRMVVVLLLTSALATPVPGRAQSPLCGTLRRHPKTYAHVVWVWMENHSYGQIIGSSDAPYINGLATDCGSATNFHNLTHVSLPNYVGAVTGADLTELQPFLFDCNPTGTCRTGSPSLFAQAASWKAYEESMVMNCQTTGFVGYAVRHNPPPYLTSLPGCSTYDVPYTALQADLDNDTLPAFSFITPNTVSDMHDGPDPTAIQTGDTWLSNELPKIFASNAYQSGNTVVVVTFDEGAGGSIGEDCANEATTDESCHIVTLVISPYTRPATAPSALKKRDRFFTHYSLLRTTEQLLGVRPRDFLGLARRARTMRRAFNL